MKMLGPVSEGSFRDGRIRPGATQTGQGTGDVLETPPKNIFPIAFRDPEVCAGPDVRDDSLKRGRTLLLGVRQGKRKVTQV